MTNMNPKTTYKDAGVDIDAGNRLVRTIKPYTEETKRNEVISGIGGFAGLFAIKPTKFENPVLVATTDGVGTKLKVALDCHLIENIGQDLVAMCVNDLLCSGAEPLFFLDYYATGKLDVDQAASIIKCMCKCLKEINCTLLGGETAEMPGLYQNNDFDIAGFTVGVVDRDAIIDGSAVRFGDKLIALESAGIHSTGFSLIRKIMESQSIDLKAKLNFSNLTLGEELLKPTCIYVKPILQVLKQYKIHSIAHITGGGIIENLPRVLPNQCQAVIDKSKINVLEIFKFFQKKGSVPEDEMWRVFNMGVGMILAVDAKDEENVILQLNAMNTKAYTIGFVQENKTTDKPKVVFSNE